MKQKTYYLVYQITNLLNKNIYIGVHKTYNKEDNYFGSGKLIQKAIEKYGKEHFKKEILFECKSEKEMFLKEKEIINEDFVKRKDTYNLKTGGIGSWSHIKNKITVKDSLGKTFQIDKNDQRFLSGELVGITKGTVIVKDKKDNYFNILKDDPRYLNGELISIHKGKTIVKNKFGTTFRVNAKDLRIGKTLFGTFKNRKHSEEAKRKIGEASSVHQKGSLNSQFGTMRITNGKENKKIKKEDKIPKGFRKGRLKK